jgi:alpha-glucosidase
MKKTLLLAVIFLFTACYSFAKEYKISSPDNKTTLTVNVGTEIKWSVTYDGKEIINASKIAMILANGKVLGENEKAKKPSVSQLNEIIIPVVANKRSEITNNLTSVQGL